MWQVWHSGLNPGTDGRCIWNEGTGRMTAWLTVVGIGEDGLPGLGESARQAVRSAAVLIGSQRHLDLIGTVEGQRQIRWPSPFSDGYRVLVDLYPQPVCVLASGDPMFYGVGGSLPSALEVLLPDDARQALAAGGLRVIPTVSCVSLAAARMGWSLQSVPVVAAHGRPLERLGLHLHPGARILVLSENANTPALVASYLCAGGYGASQMTVLGHLGGPREDRHAARADQWPAGEESGQPHPDRAMPSFEVPSLNVIALEVRTETGQAGWPQTAGLPDAAFRHDGQLTKQDIRAVTMSRLAPRPGELLWDVGAGSGSIGIEWMRSHPTCRAYAIESHPDRQGFIRHNRDTLGVPDLVLVEGRAPAALDGLPSPDAVFVGGGITREGVADACYDALKPGGRMIATAVTLESEAFLVGLYQRWGGDLLRLSVAHTRPIGGFLGWDPAKPVTLWWTEKAAG